jgi:hypothetical protein
MWTKEQIEVVAQFEAERRVLENEIRDVYYD